MLGLEMIGFGAGCWVLRVVLEVCEVSQLLASTQDTIVITSRYLTGKVSR